MHLYDKLRNRACFYSIRIVSDDKINRENVLLSFFCFYSIGCTFLVALKWMCVENFSF